MPTATPSPYDGTQWGIAEVVDLEAQLLADRVGGNGDLQERDSAIGVSIRDERGSARSMLRAWLASMRARADGALPGRAVEDAYRQTTWLVCLILFLFGAGSAAAVLRFTGEHPINVLVVLGVFVFAQLLTLLITVLFFAVASWAPGLFENLPLVVLVRSAVSWLWQRASRKLSSGQKHREMLGWVRGRRSLYSSLERHLVFVLLQRGAIAFNLGVLLAFLVAVTFSDLAFGWGTTLSIGAQQLHALCAALAAPWASWLPSATVDMALVEATQYSRLEGTYVQAARSVEATSPMMYGQWWRFVVACIVAYGLLPRVILSMLGRWSLGRQLAALPPETPEVQRLLQRIGSTSVRPRHRADPGTTAPLGAGYDRIGEPQREYSADDALCTRWREAVIERPTLESFLGARYGLGIDGEIGESGGHDYDADLVFLGRTETSSLPVFTIVEPWSHPDRSFRRFVAGVRERVDETRPINVVFTERGNPNDVAIWTGYLSEMADPYLALDRTSIRTPEAL